MARPFVVFLLLLAACSKEYDADFDTRVATPAYSGGNAPRVLIDQAHHNRHEVGGTYKPFVRLIESDGYETDVLESEVTGERLADADVFVIPSALGTDDMGTEPAFSAREVDAIVSWVEAGGSLLLVTDHFPFGDAVRGLATRFGVEMSGGMTFDPVHHDRATGDDSRLVFTRANGLLAPHPITDGRSASERVTGVMTFTGQSLRASGGTALLRLSDSAIDRTAAPRVTRRGSDVVVDVEFVSPVSASGRAQAIALERGRGRVVVLGEAAMITAQRDGGKAVGMNVDGIDNRQFVLNTMHWLSRADLTPRSVPAPDR